MEIIEIIVYLAVAVILGALVLVLLTSTSPEPVSNLLEQSINDKGDNTFSQVNIIQFYSTLLKKADTCSRYETDNLTLLIKEEGEINKTAFFHIIQQASLCSTIQSQQLGCGEREDIEEFSINTPSIVTISCKEQVLKIG